MSVVFFGTPEFAVPTLKALIGSGEDIALVVTQTDKVKGRGHKLTPPAVKVFALEAGLKVAQPSKPAEQSFLGELTATKPEFIVVVAYGRILPKALLELPERGCINVHASLLPKYRGAAPIAWAIIRGEDRTGVTTMLMDEGLDTGDILLQRETPITGDDTGATLGARLSGLGASLLVDTLKGIRTRSIIPVPQAGEATYAPPLKKENGHIDWSKSAREISCFVRGMQPWPGAYCSINDERILLLETVPLAGRGDAAIISGIGKDMLMIGTGQGLLGVKKLQPSGKKPMTASAFIHGRTLREGMLLQ